MSHRHGTILEPHTLSPLGHKLRPEGERREVCFGFFGSMLSQLFSPGVKHFEVVMGIPADAKLLSAEVLGERVYLRFEHPSFEPLGPGDIMVEGSFVAKTWEEEKPS